MRSEVCLTQDLGGRDSAFTFLQIERARQPDAPRPTLPVVRGWVREVLGLLDILHNRRLLGMLDSFRRNAPQRR
jgi:hypothetical protein